MSSIVEAIYSVYEKESGRVRSRRPTASDGLGSVCSRLSWYEVHSPVPKVINPKLRRRMHYGVLHEENIINELRGLENWEIKGAGYRIRLWDIPGRVDLLVRENGKWKLLEVKTMNPEDFKRFQKEGLQSFIKYYEQFMFYMAALERMPFKDEDKIERGILLAENTFPLGELHSEELSIDRDCIDYMKEHTEELEAVLDLMKPPPRPFNYNSKECKWCRRKDECWRVVTPKDHKVFSEIKNQQAFKELVLNHIRNKEATDQAEGKLEDIRRELRTLLEEEGTTEVWVPVAQDFSVQVRVSQVSVSEYSVKSHTYPKLEVTW